MPPKHKTTKSEIIETSINIAREIGIDGVTAREIGKRLGLSSRPIYSYYPSMQVLKKELLNEILNILKKYILNGNRKSDDSLFNMGIGQILFAKEESMLYRIIMEEFTLQELQTSSLDKELIDTVKNDKYYKMFPKESIKDIYFKMSLFTDGICNSIIHNVLHDDSEEFIEKLLYETGEALIIQEYIKLNGGLDEKFANFKRKLKPE